MIEVVQVARYLTFTDNFMIMVLGFSLVNIGIIMRYSQCAVPDSENVPRDRQEETAEMRKVATAVSTMSILTIMTGGLFLLTALISSAALYYENRTPKFRVWPVVAALLAILVAANICIALIRTSTPHTAEEKDGQTNSTNSSVAERSGEISNANWTILQDEQTGNASTFFANETGCDDKLLAVFHVRHKNTFFVIVNSALLFQVFSMVMIAREEKLPSVETGRLSTTMTRSTLSNIIGRDAHTAHFAHYRRSQGSSAVHTHHHHHQHAHDVDTCQDDNRPSIGPGLGRESSQV